MDLEKRIKDAIDRGHQRPTAEKGSEGPTPEQLKNRHNEYRLEMSSYIESVLAQIVDQLPGFNQETLFGEKGWGAAIHRDDLVLNKATRRNDYSRLEIFVRPMNEYFVVDLASKATVRNREIWNRSVFKPVMEADMDAMKEQVNLWAVQYVEAYVAESR